MIRPSQVLLSLSILALAGCESAGTAADEAGVASPQFERAVSIAGQTSANLTLPSVSGNGLVAKAVCIGSTGAGGNCTIPSSTLSTVARAVAAINVPTPTAVPPTSAQVISFVPAGPVDWTDFQSGANGLFSVNQDLRAWFGAEVYQVPYTFSGYVAIPPSSTPTTMSFAVGSDDGMELAVSNGTQVYTYKSDAPRSFATGGTPAAPAPTTVPVLQVTFPANTSGALYPIDLLFYEQAGQEGVELSWAPGAQTAVPTTGTGVFQLIPQASLYAPDIRATLVAQNADSPSGVVMQGTNLTYTAVISNAGTVAASNLTYTVVLPSFVTYTTPTNPSGCTTSTTSGTTTFVCSGINLAAGASTTIAFAARVATVTLLPDAGVETVDVQGVVQGEATDSTVAAAIGDTSEIYVYTSNPAAGTPMTSEDSGNSPNALNPGAGLVDDDATRFIIGQALPTPPTVTGPASASSLSAVVIAGSSGFPAGATIKVTITGAANKTCTATVQSGGGWSCASMVLSDGTYFATAAIENAAGMVGPSSAQFTINVAPPSTPVLVTPANAAVVRSGEVLLAGTAAGDAGATVNVTVTDSTNTKHTCQATIQSDSTWVCAEMLADGGYSWTASVEELSTKAGPSAASQVFTVNTQGLPAPTMNQTTPSPTNNNLPLLSGTAAANELGAAYTLAVYDGSALVCTVTPVVASWSCTPGSPGIATPLADGSHLLTAVVMDGGGNTSPASNADAFIVDTTAPAAPTLVSIASPTNQTAPVFSGTGEPGATVVVTGGISGGTTGTLCTTTVQSNGDWSCPASPALVQGSYTATATQTDAATNQSAPSGPISFTIDTSAPNAPTIVQPTSPTDVNTIALTGTADAGTTVVVRDQTGQIICTISPVQPGGWSCTTIALPDGSDTLTATSTDGAGNATSSAPVIVVVETVAPPAPILAQTTSPSMNVNPIFSGTAAAGTTVVVVVSGGVGGCTATTASNGTFACMSNTLSGMPQTYTATAVAQDAAKNMSPVSNADTFVIDTTVPGAPTINPLPALPGGEPNTTPDTQPTFTGTGTTGDMVTVETTPGGGALCIAIVQSDGTWSCTTQTNAALPPGQVTVTAIQTTPAGVDGPPASPTQTVTVVTNAPNPPTINPLPATINTATPMLSGTADAGTTVTVRDESGRVICVVDSVPAGGGWTCTPQVPLHEGTNTLSATSVGPSGLSTPGVATVSTDVDTIAPLPPILAQTASPSANTMPVFAGTAEPLSTVNIYDGGSTTPIATCIANASGMFSCAATMPVTGSPSTHSVQATATDAAGNVSTLSNTDTFVIDTTKPAPPTLNALPTPTGATPGNTNDTQPNFSGTGVPGDVVTVQSTSPSSEPLCTATVRADGTWSCMSTVVLTGDPATAYTFTANQTSPAGVSSDPSNTDQETISTIVPATPTLVGPTSPSPTQTVPLSGTGTPGTTIAVVDPTGQVVCTATVQPDGTWSCITIPLPEGTTTVTAVGVSVSGVPSAPSNGVPITVTTFGPPAPTLSQTGSPTSNTTPTFSGTAQPDSTVNVYEGATILCTTTAGATGAFTCTSTVALTPGPQIVNATATDAAGNVSPASNPDAFTVDTSVPPAPVILLNPAENGGQPGVTSNPYPVISGTGVPGDTVTVTTNGQTLCTDALVHADGTWNCTSVVSLPGDPATTYTLSGTQTSPAGVTSLPGTQTITVDTTATTAPTLDQPTTPTRNHQPAFTGTGAPGDTVKVYSGSTVLCSAQVASSGSWTCTPGSPLADGSYLLVATQLGPQGTPSGSSAMRNLVVNDAALPAPTFDQPASPSTQTEPTFTGTAQPGDTVTVTDSVSGSTSSTPSGVVCTAVATSTGAWSCSPTTPLSIGTHTFVATASDSAGNTSPPSEKRSLEVIPMAGTPVVAITSPGSGAELSDASPEITGTSTPGTTVTVTIDGATYQAQTAVDGTWQFTPPAALDVGTHTVTAVAINAAGNRSSIASTAFSILADLRARGGCASGGVPSPVLALFAMLVLLRLRRRSAGMVLVRSTKSAGALRSLLRRPLNPVAAALALAIVAIPTTARAQADFDLETFRPAAGGDGYAGVEGARPPIDADNLGRIDAKLWLDGTNKPLTVLEPDGSTTHALVRQRYDGWLSAQFHLNGPLSISAQIPFLLGQNGDLTFLPPAARGPSSFSASIGDVRLTPRVALLRQEKVGVDAAVQASIELPTGNTDSLSSDDRTVGEGLFALGHRFYLPGATSLEILGNVYAKLRPPREILDVKVGSSAGLRAAIGYYFGSESKLVPQRVFGELDAQSYLRAGFSSGSAPTEWRVGGTWCIGHNLAIDAAVGTGIGNGVGAPSGRGLLAFGYSPASCRQTDRDGDGIIDREDKCPDVPGVPELAGCPAPPAPADRDHDGVPDDVDACPDEPGLKENRGCPADHDRDGDGVPDMVDRCPDLPGPASNQGCPEEKAPVCAPEPPKELPLPEPPPPPPDRDHDGVPDAEDNCPDEPGPKENHGCPLAVKQLVVINGAKIDILDKVYFATGKSQIQARSYALLDQVAQLLIVHPELSLIEVQGHTDNDGDPKKNLKLSQIRAEAVRAYLIKRNVVAARLTAKGYGSEQPVTPNTTRAAKDKNRRVEFHVLEVKSRTIEVAPVKAAGAQERPDSLPLIPLGASPKSDSLPAIPASEPPQPDGGSDAPASPTTTDAPPKP